MLEQEITKEIDLINSISYNGDNRINYYEWVKFRKEKGYSIIPLEQWIWKGKPSNNNYIKRFANKLILQATLEECLTSPSEYVRECKKYFEAERNAWQWCYDAQKMSEAS